MTDAPSTSAAAGTSLARTQRMLISPRTWMLGAFLFAGASLALGAQGMFAAATFQGVIAGGGLSEAARLWWRKRFG